MSEFTDRIEAVVRAIPPGQVLSYGDVAALAGSPRAARQAGQVMARLPADSDVPWHRVVRSSGEFAPGDDRPARQRRALAAEGLVVPEGRRVPASAFADMDRLATRTGADDA